MTVRPLLLALALSAASSLAQAQAIVLTHTGYLLDSGDQPLSATLPMTFGLYDEPSGGNLLWAGDAGGGAPCQVSVVAGYYAVQLGGTGPGSCGTALTSAVFGSATRHLELRINAVTLAPRQPLAAVPLASRALTADLLGTKAASDFALKVHEHTIDNVTGLTTALGGKLSAEADPKVGAILAGQWCTGSSEGKVACTSDAPAATGAQANAGVATAATCAPSTAGYLWYDSAAFAVKVCNGASYVTMNTVTAPPGPPGAPTVSSASSSLGVSWTIASGATSYEVGYKVGSVIDASATVVEVASGTSTTLSGLTNGTAYAVAVRSVAGTWKSAWSSVTPGTPSACSAGYILVPQTTLPEGPTVAPFCVMQFEAKDGGSGVAVSQALAMPWVSINWTDAKTKCTNAGAGKHLITENEWLAIANNAANEGSNWTGSIVGSGKLFLGNNISSAALAGSDPLSGDQRRTLTLSNGAVVWDLAGNVWEWTDQTISATLRWHNGLGWMEYPAATDLPREKRPPDLSWDWNQGMGRYYSTGPADESAFLRGGHWGGAAYAGVFALDLSVGRAGSGAGIGFRCAGP